ncbi:hypothetical protein RSOLAG1IB_12664 [Rhizoctonia solani AG-1 IB]|nr:hypothetical protein RSOLAG1IB_12664 [Rhizoctonia solani AG-1 IB]
MRLLIALGTEAKRAKDRWDYYNHHNAWFGPELQKWSTVESSVFPQDVQPLIRMLLARHMSWLRAKAMAPYVFTHWKVMTYILREAIHLYATTERLIDSYKFPESALSAEITAEDLLNQVKRTKAQVFELSYICSELKEWHNFTIDITGRLEGNWPVLDISSLGDIIQTIDGIMEWIYAAYDLSVRQMESRTKRWDELGLGTPYKGSNTVANYLFGSIGDGEEPKGLEAALKNARRQDPSRMVMKERSKSIEDIMSESLDGLAETTLENEATQTVHSPPIREPAPGAKSTPTPPASSSKDDTAQSKAEMNLDAPLLVNSPPSNLPELTEKSKPDSRTGIAPPPPPTSIEPGPDVDPTPALAPTPAPAPTLAPTPTPTPVAEPTPSPQVGDSDTRSSRIPTQPSALEESSLKSKGKGKGKGKSKAAQRNPMLPSPPSASALPLATPETRQTRKRKPAPETDVGTSRGKRLSVRLQAKETETTANMGAQAGKDGGRIATRSSRRK